MSQSYPTFFYLDVAIEEKYYSKPRRLTPVQKAALINAFEKDPYLNIQTSLSLLREEGIPRRTSTNWFCRKRVRQRKQAEKTVQCKYAYMYIF